MLRKIKSLILYDMKEIEIPEKKEGKETGEVVTKFKYSFFDKNLNICFGYDDDGKLKEHVIDIEEMKWDDSKAKKYAFEVTVWDDVQKEKLIGLASEDDQNAT